jgi:hypothetical protein
VIVRTFVITFYYVSGTVINYGLGSNFLTSYGSYGSGSTTLVTTAVIKRKPGYYYYYHIGTYGIKTDKSVSKSLFPKRDHQIMIQVTTVPTAAH